MGVPDIDGTYPDRTGSAPVGGESSDGAGTARFPGGTARVDGAIRTARYARDAGMRSDLPITGRIAAIHPRTATPEARAERLTDIVRREADCPRFTPAMRDRAVPPAHAYAGA